MLEIISHANWHKFKNFEMEVAEQRMSFWIVIVRWSGWSWLT